MSPPLDEKCSLSFLSSVKVLGSPLMQRRDEVAFVSIMYMPNKLEGKKGGADMHMVFSEV